MGGRWFGRWRVATGALGTLAVLANVYGMVVDGPTASRPAIAGAVPEHFSRSLSPPEAVTDFFARRPAVVDFDWLVAANDTVADVLMHAHRTVRVGENWLLWAAGSVWYPLKDTQDAEKVLASRGGICDDAANVLMAQLKRVGVAGRFVAIGGRTAQPLGHAFLEVRLGDRWVIADPDYRVAFPFSLDELRLAPDGPAILASALAGQGWGPAAADLYADIMLLNPVTTSSPGAPLGDKLALVEAAAGLLKWPLALALLLTCLARTRRPSRRRRGVAAIAVPDPPVRVVEMVGGAAERPR